MYSQVSADVQGKEGNWPFVQNSGDVKAAAILGSCASHTQCAQGIVPKIGMSKCF
jgi:hypothetical protein